MTGKGGEGLLVFSYFTFFLIAVTSVTFVLFIIWAQNLLFVAVM